MKYYGKSSLSSFLKNVLDIMIVFGVGLFAVISKRTLFSTVESVTPTLAFVYGLFIVGSFSLIFIVYHLRNIIKTLVHPADPFVRSNVKSLRRIWFLCFVISGCYFINFFINASYKSFKLIYLDTMGIHTDLEFFVFFFAGLFIVVLEKVFQAAVEYKEDNDLTI